MNDGPNRRVSVCIVGRNVRPYLEQSLPLIHAQTGIPQPEILFADNESEDGSAEVAEEYGARVIPVPKAEFSHVHTRRRLASEAAGDVVVMLVGDAVPHDEHWLRRLVEPLERDPLVALCYSRWLPRPDAPPVERTDISIGFPPRSAEAYVPPDDPVATAEFRQCPYPYFFCSNVSAAYRRAEFLDIPFPPGLSITEDQFAGWWFLGRGRKIRYCALSRVWHSHRESFAAERRRTRHCVRGFFEFSPVDPPCSRNVLVGFAASAAYALMMVGTGRARVRDTWAVFRSKLARKLGELDAVREGRRARRATSP